MSEHDTQTTEAAEAAEITEGAQATEAQLTTQGPETTQDAHFPEPAQKKESGRNYRKVREGLVVSDKMQKTVVVALEDRKRHALYGKIMRTTKRVKAHDEQNAAGVGDRVLLMETRPLSANKHWRLVEIVEKAK